MKPPAEAYEKYLAGLSEATRKLAEEFPFGTVFLVGRRLAYLIGHGSDKTGLKPFLILSAFDPATHYAKAVENLFTICPGCARNPQIKNLGSPDKVESLECSTCEGVVEN